MRVVRRVIAAIIAVLAAPTTAAAQDACLSADPPPPARAPQLLRFGITPGAAGTAGVAQGAVAPRDERRLTRSLLDLRGRGRELVLRLNRLFWADGDEGIDRFAALVDRYARAGLRSEVQLRYHPPEGAEGDIDAWEAWVREAVRRLAARPAVVGFSVTNEANLPVSPNTSDGAYEGVVDALVSGVAAAGAELRAMGRRGLPVGFNVAWRYTPDSDAAFWREVGAKATPAFRRALTYVGVQVYPGLVWPPAPLPGRTAGREVAEALTLVRGCFMPQAGLGRGTALWVSENGYATNLGRTESAQAGDLGSTLEAVHAYSGELGVTDYRYFNLRDNASSGTDLFAAVGLLRDDHTRKPAFAVMRDAVAARGGPPLSARARRRGPRLVVWGTVPPPCPVRVRVRAGAHARGASAGPDCRFRVSLRSRARFARVSARGESVRVPRRRG